jgi:hypothetical protein
MSKFFFIILLLGSVAQAQESLETIEVSENKNDSFSEYWKIRERRFFLVKKILLLILMQFLLFRLIIIGRQLHKLLAY